MSQDAYHDGGEPDMTGLRTGARRARTAVLVATLLVAAAPLRAAGYQRPGTTEIVSVTSDGTRGNGNSGNFANATDVSNDGRYVVFSSCADNLDPRDNNGAEDVFRHDRRTGKTELASLSSLGLAPSPGIGSSFFGCLNGSRFPAMSGNGRFIAFQSASPDVVVGDTYPLPDVFVRDMKKGTTEIVSVTSDGEQPLGPGGANGTNVTISVNGRHVAFTGNPELDPEGCPPPNPLDQDPQQLLERCERQALVHDRKLGTTEIVSKNSEGEPLGVGGSGSAYGGISLSADGRYMGFTTPSSDVYVHERVTGKTTMVNVTASGQPSNDGGFARGTNVNSISGDGRYVLFSSNSNDLVPNDSDPPPPFTIGIDVFVRDRKTGRMERTSVDSAGQHDSAGQRVVNFDGGSISDNGRYVVQVGSVFSPAYVPGCDFRPLFSVRRCSALFVHDRETGALEPSVLLGQGDQAGTEAHSSKGRYVSFAWETDQPQPRGDNAWDVFLLDRGTPLRVGGLSARGERMTLTQAPETRPAPAFESSDPTGDSLPARPQADLISARLAYRPQYSDLFVRIDVASMDAVLPGVAHPELYGVSFDIGDTGYEIRMQRTPKGTISDGGAEFVLYRCSSDRACSPSSVLKGGYGTVGQAIVVAVPLSALGLQGGGELSSVRAFSSFGALELGGLAPLDEIELGTFSLAHPPRDAK